MMVGVTRGLQIARPPEERQQALSTRAQVVKTIGGLARGPGAARYHDPHKITGADGERDDAPLLGTPHEIIARLKRLETGGGEEGLLCGPKASVGPAGAFAARVSPAFAAARPAV